MTPVEGAQRSRPRRHRGAKRATGDAALTALESFPIFALCSEKCCADAHGLPSDRLPAQDRLPDARRPAEARAAYFGALGGDGSLSPSARGLAQTAIEIHLLPARQNRQLALRQVAAHREVGLGQE